MKIYLSYDEGVLSRWILYETLEIIVGRACLLRTVCEAAEVPLYVSTVSGLLGQIVHVLLTPSTSREPFNTYADREYQAAEIIGRDIGCSLFYQDCPNSPLDHFSYIFT